MSASAKPSRPPLVHGLLAGLAAGAVASIAASFVSLLLQSPDRALLNTISITALALLAGVGAGALWEAVGGTQPAFQRFAGLMALVLLLVAGAAFLVAAYPGQPLHHVVSFCVPLAVLVLVLLTLLTPLLAGTSLARPQVAGPVGMVLALVVGIALAGHGSGSGKLALPSAKGTGPTSGAGTELRPKDVAGAAFVVDPSQSKASYTVNERLTNLPLPDDAVGTTSNVSGTVFLDGRPSTITVDMTTFKSDDSARDQHLLRDPGMAKWAPAQFTVAQLELPNSYKPGDIVRRDVQGTLTLNDVQKPTTFAVEARMQGDALFIHGQTNFTWKDFNITPPTFSRVLQIADTIHAEVILVAPKQPPSS
jgi:polyisoprenoid-binding protein YceI